MRIHDTTSDILITMRHEEKFICSEKDLTLLHSRLRTVLKYDSNQTGADYQIRSLYLDTFDDRLYRESLYGVERRRKYRIRFYNMRDDFIRLERKDTVGRLKKKKYETFDIEQVERLLNGEGFDENCSRDEDHSLLQEVYALQQIEGLRPVAIVDYHRTAFTEPIGNIRITFDRNISCSNRIIDFNNPDAVLLPLLPRDRHILEVKYDGIMPGYIASILNIANLERISFSKYANARNTIENNGRNEGSYEL